MAVINKEFLNKSMSMQLLDARLAHIFNGDHKVLVTSSFGTTSAILLHAINRVKPGYPIYFIDTKFHFDATIAYKRHLTNLMNLNVIDLRPDDWKHEFTEKDKTWKKDPDFCCQINKVEPLQTIRQEYSVWVSGLMYFQSGHRSNLEFIEEKDGMYKYYPVLDWKPSMVQDYFEQFGLPRHPLQNRGYDSIGCTHCTQKGACRSGRWQFSEKTECGLHL